MRFVKQIFDFYIQSSIHVAIAVVCLVYITDFSNDLNHLVVYPTCVFFGTVVGYNFLKYFQIFQKGKFHHKKYYGILIVSLLSVFGFLYFFLWLERSVQILILVSGLLVLIYPFLRKLGYLKLFFVSLVVTIISVFIPFYIAKRMDSDFYLTFIQRFLILVSLVIPFEILDSSTDAQSLQTLPQQFGINSTKLFGILHVILFIILEYFKVNSSLLSLPIGIISGLFILFSTIERNKYYTSFWVESVPIFWLLALLFCK
jgi:hypothetical protein